MNDKEEVQLAEIRKDVQSLSDVIAEMRAETKEWRARQMQILEKLAENKTSLAFLSGSVRTLESDTDSLKAWRWYTMGLCAALSGAVSTTITSALP